MNVVMLVEINDGQETLSVDQQITVHDDVARDWIAFGFARPFEGEQEPEFSEVVPDPDLAPSDEPALTPVNPQEHVDPERVSKPAPAKKTAAKKATAKPKES
jgi:hypothetical protein